MVVASKPALHVYRIRDREGNEYVVHRNLLLQVNFLPLDVALNDDTPHPADNVTNGPSLSDLGLGLELHRLSPLTDSLSCINEHVNDHTATVPH